MDAELVEMADTSELQSCYLVDNDGLVKHPPCNCICIVYLWNFDSKHQVSKEVAFLQEGHGLKLEATAIVVKFLSAENILYKESIQTHLFCKVPRNGLLTYLYNKKL